MTPHLHNLALAFLGGLAASITPCVYPLIPVTLAIFGATGAVSRKRAFLLSCSYVLGMAAMYTSLGLLSALTGSLLGEALRNPWIIVGMSLFLIMLSLYTLDVFQFQAAYRLQAKASAVGGKGFLGAFLMGTASGIVAAPCAAPLLIAILGSAAQTQSMFWGALLLFCYSIGFGIVFLLLGTFSGLLHKLPRSGDWLHMVKFVISAALMTVAFFLIKPVLAQLDISLRFTSNILLVAAFMVIAFLAATIGYRRDLNSVKIICAFILGISLYQIIFPSPAEPARGAATYLTWNSSSEMALERGKSKHKIVFLDFFAEWCAACKELEQITFKDSSVSAELSKLSLGRVDLTLADDETDAIQQRFAIRGLPTLIFLCPNGKEIPGTRIEGYLAPQEFLAHLKQAEAKATESACPGQLNAAAHTP